MQNFRTRSLALLLARQFSTVSPNIKPASLNHLFIPATNPQRKPLNLIVLHGLLGSSSNFRTIISNPKISSQANSYLLDLRNHGASEHRSTMSSQEMANDVHNFIQENNLASNLVIMGHSMGARVTMSFCSLFPDLPIASIIVDLAPYDYKSDPRFNFMEETKTMLKKLAEIDMNSEYKVIVEKIRAAAANKMVADFVMTNLRKEDSGKYRWKCNLEAIISNYGEIIGAPEGESKGRFKAPVRVIFGEKSDYYAPDLLPNFRKIFPNFDEEKDLKIIKDAGHWVHFAKPVEFVEDVSTFLKSL